MCSLAPSVHDTKLLRPFINSLFLGKVPALTDGMEEREVASPGHEEEKGGGEEEVLQQPSGILFSFILAF